MSKNKHIDLEDIEDDVNINNFDDNVILDNSTELFISEGSGSITELLMKDNTSLNNNSKGRKTISIIWEYMYKKYNDIKQVVTIICNLYKKEYGPKTSIQLLMDHINKEHKHNISIK